MNEAVSRAPRIALVGNMNNNAFSLMRYFRDLGADAAVFPFSTDAAGASAHFAPQADTADWDKWSGFVRTLPVPNSNEAIVGKPQRLLRAPSLKCLAASVATFDRVLGTGIAPALYERMGLRLDGFAPYSVGIEFYGTPEFARIAGLRSLRGIMHRRVRELQARGTRKAGVRFNADLGLTRESFERIGADFAKLPMPMVYNGERYAGAELRGIVGEAAARMDAADLALFSASRHLWVRGDGLSDRAWQCSNKNSDWIFRALARFVAKHPDARPLLVSIEYGPDAVASKQLVAELGIAPYVLWLPILPRRDVMALLSHADIGVGEFLIDDGLLWGGTGFETLASGRPLLQAFNFTADGFARAFGYAPPPILDAKSSADAATRLDEVYADRSAARRIGAEGAKWFDEHAGLGLARRWLEALINARPDAPR